MGVFTIPTETDSLDFSQRMDLDGATFVLRFRFNARIGKWLLDLYDGDEAPLALGRLLASESFPWQPFQHNPAMPKGQLFVHDSDLRPRDPGLNDLGTRVILIYLDAAELESLL